MHTRRRDHQRKEKRHVRRIILAGLVAGIAASATAIPAHAAPSMTVTNVVAPTSAISSEASAAQTTWRVKLSGVNGWETECTSTAHYVDDEYVDGEDLQSVEGDDVNPNGPWNDWSFAADTPTEWQPSEDWAGDLYSYLPFQRVTATCALTRDVYLGRRYWREVIYPEKRGSSAFARGGGCSIYSYSYGKLTIDCRRSKTWGWASWRFPLRRADWPRRSWVYFDRSESTLGRHHLTSRLAARGRAMTLTERVSPGTMITVNSVELPVSRRYSKEVWRTQTKTLRAAWPS
jgi:hypothetical protein